MAFSGEYSAPSEPNQIDAWSVDQKCLPLNSFCVPMERLSKPKATSILPDLYCSVSQSRRFWRVSSSASTHCG